MIRVVCPDCDRTVYRDHRWRCLACEPEEQSEAAAEAAVALAEARDAAAKAELYGVLDRAG